MPKSFKTNPALGYFVDGEKAVQEQVAPQVRLELTTDPLNKDEPVPALPVKPAVEPRSKRMQLLVCPSLYDKLRAYSVETGWSMNEIVNHMLDAGMKDYNPKA